MDDLYGFLRYARRDPPKQRVPERIRHWREYVAVLPDELMARQANRCMDCGTPWCHRHCPVHNLIPEWNALVCDAHWRRAWEQLDSTNNFPELTGRLCPAPCEDACTLSLADRPVTIKSIELAIAERAWQSGWVTPQLPKCRRNERIAVVGSGPAGLACAQLLARCGYRTTVYEKADRPGGLLRYGIPDFRLEKSILERRLRQLQAEGVTFRTGVHVGVTLSVDTLQRSADAVVLAGGCEQPRDIEVPGRGLRGIWFAMDYLAQQNHRVAGDMIEREAAISAAGKDVVVIGGGDTGCDCVGTAIRQGARRVTQVQYHDRPPLRADVLQYWPQRVPVLRPTDTEQEGCQRIWGWSTVAFTGRDGRVAQVVMQRLRWEKREDNSWRKWCSPDEIRCLPAQLVLLAMGYAHPVQRGMLKQLNVALDARGNVSADERNYLSTRPGVFVCGDMRRGQSLVVWAIREGRQCARAVDHWLSGDSELPAI
ncbi:MAG: glutamate synthase subunit beta [Thiogranum sp.]|nr:glutamate synthase subunit beta [Thiogranum sp.]